MPDPPLQGERWHRFEIAEILRRQERMRIRALCVDAEGDPFTTTKSAVCRFTIEGRRRTTARIYSFIDYLKMKGYDTTEMHFVTLTTRHDTTGSYRSHKETLNNLRWGWQLLRQHLAKQRKTRNVPIEYLKVIEPGELRGYPHLHIIIAGGSDALCERLIGIWVDTYNLGVRDGQEWSVVRDIEHAGAYLRKYLIKAYEDDNPNRMKWAELCYRERIRTFSMSGPASRWIADKYRDPLKGLSMMGEKQIDYDI